MSAQIEPEQDQKIAEILEVIYKLAFGDLSARTRPGDQGNDIDAIMTGLNMLAEELEARVATIEEAQIELQDSEARFRAVLNNTLDGISVSKISDHSIYMVNDALCGMFGYSREEVLTKKLSDMHRAEDVSQLLREYEKVVNGITSNICDFPARRKDGSIFDVEISSVPMQFHGEQYLVTSFKDITERKLMENELSRLYREHHAVTDGVSDLLYRVDINGKLLWWNRAFEEVTGLTKTELLSRGALSLFYNRDWPVIVAHREELLTTGYSEVEARFKTRHGLVLHEFNASLLKDDNGGVIGITGVGRDISERRVSEEKLRQAAKVFENTTEGVMITDGKNHIVDTNDAFTDITGYSRNEVLGKNPRLLSSGKQDAAFYINMWKSLSEQGRWKGEIWNRRKGGEVYPQWLNVNAIRNGKGDVVNYVAVFSDITAIKNTEQRLQHIAQHDPLTDLPNRLLFNEQLQHALERARRRSYMVGVMFLDLDRFKNVNDSLGHNVGDSLLQRVARLLLSCVRGEDIVGRLGGDEFVIILEQLPNAELTATVAQRIIDAFKQPFEIEGYELYAGASIGISIFPDDGADAQTLIKNADTAMYRAKELGRSGYHYYSPELTADARERLTMETALRRALERKEFRLYYQPQVSLKTGEITGVEALVRWERPGKGIVSPAKFIPLAEETGLIIPLGEWVLQNACEQAKAWQQQGLGLIRVAVNMSPKQITNNDMVESVRKALRKTGLDPRSLELEVTEDLFMEASEETLGVIEKFKDIGITLSVDDFGTGYSSLNYLKRLPIDKLKIDQSFVRDIPYHADDMTIARAVIALGHSLNLVVIAEGVETEQQLEFLRAEGCDEYQGYLCSKPLPAEELARFWRHH